MKTRIVIYLMPLLLLMSCTDSFTSLAPISQRNIENFYRTQNDFNVALSGAYDALQEEGAYGKNYVLMLSMRADNLANGGGATGLAATLEAIDQFDEIATASELQATWSDSYKGISRTNSIIGRIDDADFDEAAKNQIKGEALFLRSLFYYNLAVIFGNIPIQLEEISSSTDVAIEQVAAGQIYSQIIADLETAQGVLPASYSGTNIGRATSGAANALLGKVYLTSGDNAGAETALRRVVDSSVYDLVPDYADIWGIENENNIESVFEVQFKAGGIGEGSGFTDFFFPGTVAGAGDGNVPQLPTENIVNEFEAGDERLNKSLNEDYVDNVGETIDQDWVIKYESTPFSALDADNNWIVIRYADVLLMLAEAIGEGAEAYDLINQVRDRSGLGPIGPATAGSFEDKLLEERRVELAFENHRWPDLLRFGKAKEMVAAQLEVPESKITLLFPIPQREIDVAPDQLVQNPEHAN